MLEDFARRLRLPDRRSRTARNSDTWRASAQTGHLQTRPYSHTARAVDSGVGSVLWVVRQLARALLVDGGGVEPQRARQAEDVAAGGNLEVG